MTIFNPLHSVAAVFGAGPTAPYSAALRTGSDLVLHRDDDTKSVLPVTRWLQDPDLVDDAVLQDAVGPVLDVGCGPGRMLHAAARAGLTALGIDTEETATGIARREGRDAVTGNIFDALPEDRLFGTVLLLDGNIGIGGDPRALMARCGDLLAPDGILIVETHPDRRHNKSFLAYLTDVSGNRSNLFPWAEVGTLPLLRFAGSVGLRPVHRRTKQGRTFQHLQRNPDMHGNMSGNAAT
jgi:SAM-dependent methyltransferase